MASVPCRPGGARGVARSLRSRASDSDERGSALLGAAAVLLTIARLARRPLDLVELGPSAGLNLLWDRYGYRLRGRELGRPSVAAPALGRGTQPGARSAVAHIGRGWAAARDRSRPGRRHDRGGHPATGYVRSRRRLPVRVYDAEWRRCARTRRSSSRATTSTSFRRCSESVTSARSPWSSRRSRRSTSPMSERTPSARGHRRGRSGRSARLDLDADTGGAWPTARRLPGRACALAGRRRRIVARMDVRGTGSRWAG